MKDGILYGAVAVAALAAITLLAMGPAPDECETYREMRQIHEESRGEFGWPRGAIKGCSYGDG